MIRVPLMFIQPSVLSNLSKRFKGYGKFAARLIPGLEYDVLTFGVDIDALEYSFISLFNSTFLSIFFFVLMFVLSFLVAGRTVSNSLALALAVAFAIFIVFTYIYLRYPSIYAGKKAELVEKNLVFVLKDLLLQVSSGIGLYNAMVTVYKSNYGEMSLEFEKLAKKVNTGVSIESALETLSVRTKSDYLKRTSWQLMNAVKAGASLREALRTLILELNNVQHVRISNYAKELNLWSLLYMLFSVAIPTMGFVMLVVLGSFAGFDVTPKTFIIFILIDVFIQVAIIGFIKSRRTVVQF